SNFIVQALTGKPITLYGEGMQTRSFGYVDDLIDGALRLMNTPDDVTGPINIGNPVETTVRALAEKIIDMTGSSSQVIYKPLPHDDPMQRCPDITKARTVLGWEPTTQLEEGLGKTIAYFEKLLQLEQIALA